MTDNATTARRRYRPGLSIIAVATTFLGGAVGVVAFSAPASAEAGHRACAVFARVDGSTIAIAQEITKSGSCQPGTLKAAGARRLGNVAWLDRPIKWTGEDLGKEMGRDGWDPLTQMDGTWYYEVRNGITLSYGEKVLKPKSIRG